MGFLEDLNSGQKKLISYLTSRYKAEVARILCMLQRPFIVSGFDARKNGVA